MADRLTALCHCTSSGRALRSPGCVHADPQRAVYFTHVPEGGGVLLGGIHLDARGHTHSQDAAGSEPLRSNPPSSGGDMSLWNSLAIVGVNDARTAPPSLVDGDETLTPRCLAAHREGW